MKTCRKGLHQYDEKLKTCPECKKKYRKQYREKNSEQIKNKNKQYYKENSERLKQYRKENSERTKKRSKQYYKENFEKIKKRKQQYRKKNPEKTKNYHLKRLYKIDLNTYNSMLEKQDYCCAICKEGAKLHKSEKYYVLCVDHDHSCCPGDKSCGKCIRNLLCDSCNTGLGNFKDNPDLFYKAVEYLKSYEKT